MELLMVKKEKVYVFILNWNSASDCIRLVKELKLVLDDEYEYHSIVIDNDSKKEDQNQLRNALSDSELLFTNQNLGYAGGNNYGIRKAKIDGADYFCILNPDISVESNFLKVLIHQLKNDVSIGVIGPRIIDKYNRDLVFSDGANGFPEKGYKTKHINFNKKLNEVGESILNEVDYVNGSAMVFSKSILEQVGYLREDFFMYFEETEWCFRIKKAGFKAVVNTTVKVFHQSSNKSNMFYFYMHRNRIWLAKIFGSYYNRTQKKYLKIALKEMINVVFKPRLAKEKKSFSRVKGIIAGLLTSPQQ